MELVKEFYVDWKLEDKEEADWEVIEKGRFLASFDGENFNISTVAGAMPYVKVVQLLMDDYRAKDWIDALRERSLRYSNENRKHYFKLIYKDGTSGCLDVYIGARVGINYVQKFHLLHVSMNDKINQGIKVPLIDFFVLWAFVKNYSPWNKGVFTLERVGETVPRGPFYSPLEVPDFFLKAEGYTPPPAVVEEEL